MEPLSSLLSDEIKFNSEISDLDSDFTMQWDIESCFETGNIILGILLFQLSRIYNFWIIGIDLERNYKSLSSSPSSNDSVPSYDSQPFDSKQVRIFLYYSLNIFVLGIGFVFLFV